MSQGDRALGHQDHVPAVNSLVRTGPSAQPQHPSPQEFTNRFSSGKEQNLPNAGACRILTQTGRGDNHTAPPARAKKLPWPQRLTCIPSSSLLMHQKLSASMLRKTSWDRFVTSKFSTSSSAKGRKKSIREMGGTRDMGQTQGLCQAKALQEALQDSLCVRDVPGMVTAPVHSPTPPAQLKNPKRLAGHALNPVQLPRESWEGSHSTFVILLGQGLCRDKALAHWNPLAHLPWGTAGLCQLGAPQGELGEGKPSLQPETREGNSALGLGQHKGAASSRSQLDSAPKHKRGTQPGGCQL